MPNRLRNTDTPHRMELELRRLRNIIVLTLFMLCLCVPAFAETSGDIRVEVLLDFHDSDKLEVLYDFPVPDRSISTPAYLKRAIKEYNKQQSAKATLDDNGEALDLLGDDVIRAMMSNMAIHYAGGYVLNELKKYCERLQNKELNAGQIQEEVRKQLDSPLADLRMSLKDNGLGVLSINATWPITRLLLYGTKPFDPDDATKIRNKIEAARGAAISLQKIELLAIFAQLCDFKDLTIGELLERYKTFAEEVKKAYPLATNELARQSWMTVQLNTDMYNGGVYNEDVTLDKINKEIVGQVIKPIPNQHMGEQENQALMKLSAAREVVWNNLAKRGKGIVGFSGAAGKETVFTRTRTIAFVILYAAFFLRMFYIIFAKLTGNVGWGGMSPMALVLKMLMLTIAILAVPNIATFGMNVSDSARNYILDHNEKNPDFSPAQNTILLSNHLAEISRKAATALGGREDIQVRTWITELILQGIAYICSVLVSAVLGTMLLLGDVMLGIVCVTAPLILAMSIVPSCENWLAQLANSYVGFLLYGPMAALYMMLMVIAAVAYPSATMIIFITLSMIYVKITPRLPDMCEGMSALAISAVVTSMSAMPAHTAKRALKVAGEHSTRGIRRLLGAGSGGGKK